MREPTQRLFDNQTDIEVYSALNTACQSRELKMETCEHSSLVQNGSRGRGYQDSSHMSETRKDTSQDIVTHTEAAAGLGQTRT